MTDEAPAAARTLMERLPPVRGRLTPGRPLAELTWLRVGGPAEVLFQPADLADLALFLRGLPADVPVTPIGVGSNLLVRDGGVAGVVIRLGRAFGRIETHGRMVEAGAAAPDAQVAAAAARAGIAGLEFLRGVPGTIGGALAMNAGCHGSQVADILFEAEAVTREGRVIRLTPAEMGFAYREARAAEGLVFTRAILAGQPDAREAVEARMAELMAAREAAQPVREKTGGSTFRNPAGRSSAGAQDAAMPLSAWRLIDEAGCRGMRLGGAEISEKHCNFLINRDNATAAELEALAETVRARVKSRSGVDLCWEIRRIGSNLTRQ